MNTDDQVLKCRDDLAPVVFSRVAQEPQSVPTFTLAAGSTCSWLKESEAIGPDKLRPRIEPWLTALFQSEHFSLLVGSGITHAIHMMATGKKLPGMNPVQFTHHHAEIAAEAKRSAAASGRDEGNFEDHIRVGNELLRGMEIVACTSETVKQKAGELRNDISRVLGDFAASILAGENGVVTAESEKLENTFNYLVSFLMSFASRTGTRDRLQIFTTNYDRCIEMGAEVAGLHLLDRFVGSLAPVFRSSRLDVDMHYNPPGIRGEPRYLEGVARFTKLHGSVDWVSTANSILRVGLPLGAASIAPYLQAPGLKGAQPLQLMIYPNAAKDRETSA